MGTEKTKKPRMTELRLRYEALVATGVGFTEAARIIGVNYRTTKRWRSGTHWRAETKAEAVTRIVDDLPPRTADSPRFITVEERVFIADRVLAGWSIRQIARAMSRPPSTVSREIRRNANPTTGNYRPHAANDRAASRWQRPKMSKLASNLELRDYVQDRLNERWSPEQISNMLRVDFPTRPEMWVCHETVYQAIYARGSGVDRELYKALRRKRPRRRPRRAPGWRQPRYKAPMTMIYDRPDEIEAREEFGHWEGDLIIGRNNTAMATLVERKTGYTHVVPLIGERTAAYVTEYLTRYLSTVPRGVFKSLTWDQGSEMGMHDQISDRLGMPIYFCMPASPWQRGTNENTNGLLRQYFPKGMDFRTLTHREIQKSVDQLNYRPRKRLGWQRPHDLYMEEKSATPMWRQLVFDSMSEAELTVVREHFAG